jgi:hypothetical protein
MSFIIAVGCFAAWFRLMGLAQGLGPEYARRANPRHGSNAQRARTHARRSYYGVWLLLSSAGWELTQVRARACVCRLAGPAS